MLSQPMATNTSQNLRQLAAEAGLPLSEARKLLRCARLPEPHASQRIKGRPLRRVRRALDLGAEPGSGPAQGQLTRGEIDARILGPLLRKGKVGRTRTTPIENAYGHGIPDDQKAEAKERVEELLRTGILREKRSQSRRHVYLSSEGRALSEAIRESLRREAEK